MPQLRKTVLQREAEQRRDAEQARQAKIQRELLEKGQSVKQRNGDIADMNIAFDHMGKVMQVKRFDAGRITSG